MIDFIGTPMKIFCCTQLPEGTIRADVGSSEYTLQKEKKSEDYTIVKTEGSTVYIALEFCAKVYKY